MNAGELVNRASWVLGAGADPVHGTDEYALLLELANEAVRDILSRTRIHVRAVDLTLTADEEEYEIGTTVLRINNVKRGNVDLTEVDPGDIDDARIGSYGFAVVGFNRIVLSYVPATGDTLTAWYTPLPTEMTDDLHDPSTVTYGNIPKQFHSVIVDYMCWKGADIFGDQGSGRGERYRILYEGQDGTGTPGSGLGRIKGQINLRVSSGASRRRIDRVGYGMGSDGVPPGRDDYWRG